MNMKKLAAAMMILAALAGASCSKKKTAAPVKDQYCVKAQAVEERARPLNEEGIFKDPARLKTALTELRAATDAFAPDTTAEIKADYETVRQALGKLITELEKIDYDVSKAGPELQALSSDQQVQAASERVDAYHKRRCPGFVLSHESPSPSPSPSGY